LASLAESRRGGISQGKSQLQNLNFKKSSKLKEKNFKLGNWSLRFILKFELGILGFEISVEIQNNY